MTGTNNVTNDLKINIAINEAMSEITAIQYRLDTMLHLQQKVGSFMDEVMEMKSSTFSDSFMSILIHREDASDYVSVVLQYILNIIPTLEKIHSTLNTAFELSNLPTHNSKERTD